MPARGVAAELPSHGAAGVRVLETAERGERHVRVALRAEALAEIDA